MNYRHPEVTKIGYAIKLVTFGSIYKNPPVGDTCGDVTGVCPAHEMDE